MSQSTLENCLNLENRLYWLQSNALSQFLSRSISLLQQFYFQFKYLHNTRELMIHTTTAVPLLPLSSHSPSNVAWWYKTWTLFIKFSMYVTTTQVYALNLPSDNRKWWEKRNLSNAGGVLGVNCFLIEEHTPWPLWTDLLLSLAGLQTFFSVCKVMRR